MSTAAVGLIPLIMVFDGFSGRAGLNHKLVAILQLVALVSCDIGNQLLAMGPHSVRNSTGGKAHNGQKLTEIKAIDL